MRTFDQNRPGPRRDTDKEWRARLERRGEDIYGEGEPKDQNPDLRRRRDQRPTWKDPQNSRRNEDLRDHQGDRYYGSPYDVGNYASHYDQDPGNQRIGFASGTRSARTGNHGKGPRGYQRSDKRILEDINDRLYLDPYIDASDIEVQVDQCNVTLGGTVDDRNAKRRAEDIADSIPGVKNVENRIRVTKTHLAGPVRSNSRETLL